MKQHKYSLKDIKGFLSFLFIYGLMSLLLYSFISEAIGAIVTIILIIAFFVMFAIVYCIGIIYRESFLKKKFNLLNKDLGFAIERKNFLVNSKLIGVIDGKRITISFKVGRRKRILVGKNKKKWKFTDCFIVDFENGSGWQSEVDTIILEKNSHKYENYFCGDKEFDEKILVLLGINNHSIAVLTEDVRKIIIKIANSVLDFQINTSKIKMATMKIDYDSLYATSQFEIIIKDMVWVLHELK